MALDLSYKSYKRYQIDIPPGIWPDFFAQLTDENRGRLITLKRSDRELENLELLRRKPLFAIGYDQLNPSHDLIVTVSRSPGVPAGTHTHRIVSPQSVSIVTDEDGVILSCTVADRMGTQTIMAFQP